MGFVNLEICKDLGIYTLWKARDFSKNHPVTNISTNKSWSTCLIISLGSFPGRDIIIIINKCHGKRIQKVYKIPNISNILTEIFSFKLLFGLYILKASENKIKRINFKKRFYFIYHLNKSDIRNAQCNWGLVEVQFEKSSGPLPEKGGAGQGQGRREVRKPWRPWVMGVG